MTSEKEALKVLNFIARGATPGEDGKKQPEEPWKGSTPSGLGKFFFVRIPGVAPLAIGFVPVGDREKQPQNPFRMGSN